MLLIAYIIGYLIFSSLAAWMLFDHQQKKYPSIAKEDKFNDALFGVMLGSVIGALYPVFGVPMLVIFLIDKYSKK